MIAVSPVSAPYRQVASPKDPATLHVDRADEENWSARPPGASVGKVPDADLSRLPNRRTKFAFDQHQRQVAAAVSRNESIGAACLISVPDVAFTGSSCSECKR